MTIDELVSFRSHIDSFLRLLRHPEKSVSSKNVATREKAARVLDVMLPRLRADTIFYIKKFCNEAAIIKNNAFLSTIRVDILKKVREHVNVEISKTYARILRTTKK